MGKRTIISEETEKLICQDYISSNLGTEALSAKYHIGKLKIRELLTKNNVPRKTRGKQPLNETYMVNDWHTKKYPDLTNQYYLVVDDKTGFTSRDIDNKGGHLTSYIEQEYGVATPPIYERRLYYMRTGNYWWEQWLHVKVVDSPELKRCPYCDWSTIDIENRSGWFAQHLKSAHNMSITDHLRNHPEDKQYFQYANETLNTELETDTDKFIVCPLCGRKLRRLAQHLLLVHHMTKYECSQQYNSDMFSCPDSYQKQSVATHYNNIHGNWKFVKRSAAEKEIGDFINGLGVEWRSDRHVLEGQEIDIFMPEYNVGIEYNGNMWHTEKYHPEHEYHLNKTLVARQKGVSLIHIFEDEFALHKDIVLCKIRHMLKKDINLATIDGRKCAVQEIAPVKASAFLNKNHIQGDVKATLYLGVYWNGKLVGVMTFLNEGKGVWNLTRSCTDINYRCRGVSGKLFKYFTSHYQNHYQTIKSFLDRRWCLHEDSNIYIKLGFTFDGYVAPDYRYYNDRIDRYQRFHKFGFRKDKLLRKYPDILSSNMTEREMTTTLGYSRIWDCGLIRYIYKNPINSINH